MKILFNSGFKPIREGGYVTANESAGEFVLDLSDSPSKAALIEVAKSLKIKGYTKMKVTELANAVEATVKTLNLPEQNEMSTTEKINEIVKTGAAAKETDDEIIIKIVQSGVSYKAALKEFNRAQLDLGLKEKQMSTKDRDGKVNAMLCDADFKPEKYEEVEKVIEHIVSSLKGVSRSGALASVRKYAKAAEIELPKKPKGGGKKAGGGQIKKIMNWIIDNAECSEQKDFLAFCSENKVGAGRAKVFAVIFDTYKERLSE